MGKTDGIEAGGVQQRAAVRGLVLGDHLLAPAGVAGEGEAGDGIVPGQNPQFGERGGGGQKTGGVAAGVGHPIGELDALALAGQQLGNAVYPALGGAVGGGGVDDPGLGVVNQGDRLFGSGVRQAEEHQVGLVQKLSAFLQVLALVLVNEQQLDVVPAAQALVDLQAGGALFPVNIYLGSIHTMILPYALRWSQPS